MGDRTYTTIQVATIDEAALIGGDQDEGPDKYCRFGDMKEDSPAGTVKWADGDCNYAGENEMTELREAGIPHICYWAEGGDYGPGSAAYDGITEARVNLTVEGDYYARLDVNGTPNAEDIATVLTFVEVEKQAIAAMLARNVTKEVNHDEA